VVPLELATGISRRATPALAQSVALGFAKGPIRGYLEDMLAAHRRPPSRSTTERLARWLGGGAACEVMTIEPVVRAAEKLPDGAHALAIGLDRTTVPMAEERPPGEPAEGRRKRRRKPYVRKAPPPIDVKYRMAYVGTFSVVDDAGETLVTRRYHATAEEGPDELVARILADIQHMQNQRPLPLVIVQDGAPELWNLLRSALRAVGLTWREVIDRFHVDERLGKALELAEPDSDARRQRYQQWQQALDSSDRAIYRITRWLEHRIPRGPLHDRDRELLGHISYLEGHGTRIRYASTRHAGLPIGSGVTEGTCKSLIATRAKRSGQRWQQDGLTSALTLRALYQSDRFQPFWALFQKQFRAQIRAVG
jgi:hypothetical protein